MAFAIFVVGSISMFCLQDLRRIRVWGILTWQGLPSAHEKKVRRILKKQWILLGKDSNIEHVATGNESEQECIESEV